MNDDEAELFVGETIEHSMTLETPLPTGGKAWVKVGVVLTMTEDEDTQEIWDRARTLVVAGLNERLEAITDASELATTEKPSPRERVRRNRRSR